MAFSYSNSVTTENVFYTGTVISHRNVAHYTLHMTLSETGTDVATNTSTIAYKMWMTTTDWAFEGLSITATIEFTNISNITKTGTYALQYPGYAGSFPTSITLAEGTVSVPHNSDGSLPVSFKGYNTNDTGWGGYPQNMTLSGSGNLTAIPRASTLSVTSTQTMGSSYSFSITRASSGFTHKITYAFGNTSGYVLGSASSASSSASTQWAPPTSLASQAVVTGGNKSAQITYYLYTYSGSTHIGTTSITATLSIPAADTLTSVTASQTMGTAYTFTCGQNAPNYTHKLNWSFGNSSGTDSTAFTTSKSFTPSTSLGSQIPSSNSGTIYYSITTYNGSTVVGTSATKSATLSIPSGAEPTFSFSASVTNGNSLGVAIVGYSTVAWSTTGVSAKYGATIASYSFSFAGVSSTGANGSGAKLISGSAGGTSYTPTMVVTDSRGRKTTHTASAVTVYAYSAPVIVSSYAYRSDANGNRKDDGTYIAYFSNVKTDYTCGGHNTVVAEHRYRPTNGAWDSWYGHNINQQILSADWTITQSYQLEIRVRDSLGGTKSVTYTIPTASVAFNIKEGGKGAALFGYAQEDGVFEVNGKLKTTDGLLLHNDGLSFKSVSSSGIPSKLIYSQGQTGSNTGWFNVARKKLPDNNQIYPFTASLSLQRNYNNATPEAYEFSLSQSWTSGSITQLNGHYNWHQIDRIGILVDSTNHYVYISFHISTANNNSVCATINVSNIYNGGTEWESVFEHYPTANYAIYECYTAQDALSAPNIVVGNHSSAMGTISYTSATYSCNSGSWAGGNGGIYLNVPVGSWIITASARFPANTTGNRSVHIYPATTVSEAENPLFSTSGVAEKYNVKLTHLLITTETVQRPWYLWVFQDSGVRMAVDVYLRLLRIS